MIIFFFLVLLKSKFNLKKDITMKELKMFIDGRFIEHESGKWIRY